jgi:hypothetical protein
MALACYLNPPKSSNKSTSNAAFSRKWQHPPILTRKISLNIKSKFRTSCSRSRLCPMFRREAAYNKRTNTPSR